MIRTVQRHSKKTAKVWASRANVGAHDEVDDRSKIRGIPASLRNRSLCLVEAYCWNLVAAAISSQKFFSSCNSRY